MLSMIVGMVLTLAFLGAAGVLTMAILGIGKLIDRSATRRVDRMVRSAGVKPVNVQRSPLASQPILCDVCRRVVHPGRPRPRPGAREMPTEEYRRAAGAHLSIWPPAKPPTRY